MTLTEFLTARIAEDEAVARATLAYFDPLDWGKPETDDDAYRMAGPVDGPSGDGALIVDPERILAECEAKRRIVGEYRNVEALIDTLTQAHQRPDLDEWEPRSRALETVLAILALPYAGHPDYDEAWRP